MEIEFPIEFIVEGTPVSGRAGGRPESRVQWKQRVKSASKAALPEVHFASRGRMSVTIFYFPRSDALGDVDNLAKPILDAMTRHVYVDDGQVQRLVVQKFEPGNVFQFGSPSRVLLEAITRERPIVYVGLSDDPFEDLS